MTIAAPGFGGTASTESAKRWLGTILIVYGAWGLWHPTLPDFSGRGPWLGAVAGVATGVVTASTAVFVLPWVPYLQSLRLSKDEMVQALGLSFTVATLALLVRVQSSAATWWSSTSAAVTICWALAGAFAGMRLGAALRGQLAGACFQKALFGVFIALGAVNLLRAG